MIIKTEWGFYILFEDPLDQGVRGGGYFAVRSNCCDALLFYKNSEWLCSRCDIVLSYVPNRRTPYSSPTCSLSTVIVKMWLSAWLDVEEDDLQIFDTRGQA